MQKLNKEMCTGCGACYNICPVGAIKIGCDQYGFYKPVIDINKCTGCGFCGKICPLDNYQSINNKPKAYALINKDEQTRFKCASGGAFAAFAKYILAQNGIVYGVVWSEDIVAVHDRAENENQLIKMYSSKYVQANTKDSFKQTKKDLEKGKKVLYSGTPCQIAGLKSFLGKEYENLVTVDLICHGVPSSLIFEKYKKEFHKKRSDEKLKNINFRSKINGWGGDIFCNIETNKNQYIKKALKDSYMKAFLFDIAINNSCLNCQFNQIPRIADITIGDFWGVDDYDSSLNDNKGTSIVLVNNEKGRILLNQIEPNCRIQEVPLEVVKKRNPNINSSSKAHKHRKKFLEDVCIKNRSLEKTVKKYAKIPLHIIIYRMLPQFVKNFIKYNILKLER